MPVPLPGLGELLRLSPSGRKGGCSLLQSPRDPRMDRPQLRLHHVFLSLPREAPKVASAQTGPAQQAAGGSEPCLPPHAAKP